MRLAGSAVAAYDDEFYTKMFHDGVHRYETEGTATIKGEECVIICMISPYRDGVEGYTRFWINNRGRFCKIIKTSCCLNNDPGRPLYVREFKHDSNNDTFLPVSMTYEKYDPKTGRRITRKTCEIIALTVGEDIDPEQFDMSFPNGTKVHDLQAGVSYIVGGFCIDEGIDKMIGLSPLAELPDNPRTTQIQKGEDQLQVTRNGENASNRVSVPGSTSHTEDRKITQASGRTIYIGALVLVAVGIAMCYVGLFKRKMG